MGISNIFRLLPLMSRGCGVSFPLDVIHLSVVRTLVPLEHVTYIGGRCCVLRLFQLVPCFFFLMLLKLLVHSFTNVAAVSLVGGGTLALSSFA